MEGDGPEYRDGFVMVTPDRYQEFLRDQQAARNVRAFIDDPDNEGMVFSDVQCRLRELLG